MHLVASNKHNRKMRNFDGNVIGTLWGEIDYTLTIAGYYLPE